MPLPCQPTAPGAVALLAAAWGLAAPCLVLLMLLPPPTLPAAEAAPRRGLLTLLLLPPLLTQPRDAARGLGHCCTQLPRPEEVPPASMPAPAGARCAAVAVSASLSLPPSSEPVTDRPQPEECGLQEARQSAK